jgi:hypothetical protein
MRKKLAAGQARLAAYCTGVGVLGTLAAALVSLEFTGTARLVAWALVVVLATLAGGLSYRPRSPENSD